MVTVLTGLICLVVGLVAGFLVGKFWKPKKVEAVVEAIKEK